MTILSLEVIDTGSQKLVVCKFDPVRLSFWLLSLFRVLAPFAPLLLPGDAPPI